MNRNTAINLEKNHQTDKKAYKNIDRHSHTKYIDGYSRHIYRQTDRNTNLSINRRSNRQTIPWTLPTLIFATNISTMVGSHSSKPWQISIY